MDKRWQLVGMMAPLFAAACAPQARGPLGVVLERPQQERRLTFQAKDAWTPRVNINSDVAMVYGIDATLPKRLASWREKGYLPEVMTGVAWGEYQDYLYGRFDGVQHLDEVQTESNGHKIGHGGDVYYMCPAEGYGRFLCEGVGRALEAGATAIYLEEPEFWVRAGWSEGFKREWQAYYGEPWSPPDSSPDAQYRASKLKYYLYRRALGQVFAFVRAYGEKHGRKIPCYVATHSVINYASWGICSPESSLLEVGCDGYIAQVWTGTARTPNSYEGVKRERTFETAFLEYGAMQNLARASGRAMWYLNDPIEDNPNHTWEDYRTNWESTLAASLLQPEVWRYEVMPWPHRIFQRRPARRIPAAYETELQAVISAQGDMKRGPDEVRWRSGGTPGVGVLIADTLMFQQWGPNTADHDLGHFYGLALPLLMKGMPVEPVQIETATLDRYRVLLLSYEGQKPPSAKLHEKLAAWVKGGGALVVVDDDRDPFNGVREWWNDGAGGAKKYGSPRGHLFEALGVAADREGLTAVGKGAVFFQKSSPTRMTHSPRGADRVRAAVAEAMKQAAVPWVEAGALILQRGPYIVAAGLENGATVPLDGHFIPLFDAQLPAMTHVDIHPGDRKLLVDLDACPARQIVAAACRVTSQVWKGNTLTCEVDGIDGSGGVLVLKSPAGPARVTVEGVDQPGVTYDGIHEPGLLWVRFPNQAAGRKVTITW